MMFVSPEATMKPYYSNDLTKPLMKYLRTATLALMILIIYGCSSPDRVASSDPTEKKIDSLISLMTLEEKVTMIHAISSFRSGGVERLGIPSWAMSDGPHGVRKEHGTDYVPDQGVEDSVTYLPVGVTLASTWNPELGYAYGKVLGAEANARGKDVILGPGVNIIRTPLNGRNFEYLSEDPFLTSRMVVGYVKGVQEQGVSTSVKHYAANNQEIERNSINVEMDERALREIYLPAFRAAVVEADANTVMGAYNRFRGQFATHNEYLVNTILKGEWGFQGVLMSDWGAVQNTMEAITNGTDLEMGTDLALGPKPDYGKFYMGDTVLSLVRSGAVKEELIDDKVRRILRIMFKTHMFGKRPEGALNTREHQQIARKVAEEGIVLLKNDGVLPLKGNVRSIAIIGANADRKHAGAGGSSQVNAKYEIAALEGIRAVADENTKILYAPGYVISKEGTVDGKLMREAVNLASGADMVVYIGGWIHGYSDAWNDNAYDSESLDKPSMNLPFGQDRLISEVQKANANNIVILYGGAATDMSGWDKDAKAIIQAWYPGMEGGAALADVIFGKVNPSGKLPMTFPKKLEDSPAHAIGEYPGKNGVVRYNEGLLVGYRYFDTKDVEPLFPFGHGLSYTTFEMTNLGVAKNGESVTLSLEVKNTGQMEGAEVVQVYVRDNESALPRPDKELKAFKKVFLKPGASTNVELTLDKNAFMYYDDTKKQWVLEPGKFTILVGSSSRDIKLTGEVTL